MKATPTIREVAVLAGVSTATVSHVLNDTRRVTPETRRRVEQAIAESGFSPNLAGRSLAKHRSREAGNPAPDLSSVVAGSERDPRSEAAAPPPSLSIADAPAGTTVRALLKLVRAMQPVSRAEIARKLLLNRSTVTEIVKPLLAANVLRETDAPHNTHATVGRPPVGLRLATDETYFIAVNIGVRRTQVGAASGAGDELLTPAEVFDTPADAGQTLARVRECIAGLRRVLAPRRLAAVGVSVPAPVNPSRTRLLYAPHLGWRDEEIAARLRPAAGDEAHGPSAPVVVENDAIAAAVYESRRRVSIAADAGDGWRDFLLVRAGTGIGVGVVHNGYVYRGANTGGGLTGEFGHMTIVAGGKPCVCGGRGCWERYASASAALMLYGGERAGDGARGLRFVELVSRAASGERRAAAALARTGEYLGVGIANLIGGLGIRRVVVSGRVAYGWEFMRESLHDAVRRTMAGSLAEWAVDPGTPTGAGLGGALEVAIEEHLAAVSSRVRLEPARAASSSAARSQPAHV